MTARALKCFFIFASNVALRRFDGTRLGLDPLVRTWTLA